MFVCKDCGGPVSVSKNATRYLLPSHHIVCAACPAERDATITEGPNAHAAQPV